MSTVEAMFADWATADFLAITPADARAANPLLADLKAVLTRQWSVHPRSLQKRLGPSEVGHPCARHLAQRMLGDERINPEYDPLPSWLGIAGHTKFEDAIKADNDRIIADWVASEHETRCTIDAINGKPVGRWYSENRVTVRGQLAGTCDVYDTWSQTVIDLKFPGTSMFTKYRRHGPGAQYRHQAQLYGKGYANKGVPVETVGIWFLPRSGTLAESFVWDEPYDPSVTDDVLGKLDNIVLLMDSLDIDKHPALLELIPKVPGDHCRYCPFWVPRVTAHTPAHACTGDAK